VYVAEHLGHRIRKITPAGVVTTVAGSGVVGYVDATGTAAQFNHPEGVVVTAAGDLLVADTDNNRIRKISPAGVVTTVAGSGESAFADGTGAAASFFFPYNVALDAAGVAYVSDESNHRVRKMTPAGVVSTLAGSGAEGHADGVGAAAVFNYPSGIAVDPSGNVYVGDYVNSRIRRITPAGVVTTFAGGAETDYVDGPALTARFNFAASVATDAAGNVYVGDLGNVRVRKIVSTGIGSLDVTWTAPTSAGSTPITGYTATARAAGEPARTCATTGATQCTLERLKTGVAYAVTVVATNTAGDGAPSTAASGTPN